MLVLVVLVVSPQRLMHRLVSSLVLGLSWQHLGAVGVSAVLLPFRLMDALVVVPEIMLGLVTGSFR
jgi:hypothetical protein